MELVTDQENLHQPETFSSQESLQHFAEKLQTRLLSLSQEIPFQVQCVVRRDHLMVLSQHPPGEKPDPQQVFEVLQQTIQTLLPAFTWAIFGSGIVPIEAEAKLYLRTLGQKHPYAYYYFSLSSFELIRSDSLLDEVVQPSSTETKQLEETLDRDPESSRGLAVTGSELVLRTVEPDWEALLELEAPVIEPQVAAPEVASTPETAGRPAWVWWTVIGVGVSAISFAGGMFLMSRPCMIKTCEPLEKAEMLNQQALQTIQTAQSGQDLRQAQQQFNEVTQLLKGIPSWSRRQEDVQALLQADQAQLALIERVLAAEAQAETATQKARAIPQSVTDWQGVQALWRDAIAQLTTMPQQTPLSALVQQRLAVYRDNLNTTTEYIAAEQQAQKKLRAAKSTANIASARQGLAQSLENWQRVQVTWQVAVDNLRQVPNTTTSFVEAQQLLADYEAKLGIARDRVTQETLSKNSLTQALALAKKAVILQQQNQWTQAVATWRNAINQLNQVPDNTLYHEQAQALIGTYSGSLEQAETRLHLAVAQQKMRSDLDQICSGTPQTCTYVVSQNLIRIQFTPSYERTIQQAFASGQAGNYKLLGGAVNHVDSLQAALQAICNNAGIPLEVYDSNGTDLLGSFNPGG